MLKITDKEYDTFNVINATEEEIALIKRDAYEQVQALIERI